MRLIWKKRFGFIVVSYPVNKDIDDSPFRVGIYDDSGDMWWFSDDMTRNETVLEIAACRGWVDLLSDFASRQEFLPNGSNVLENQKDMDNEIQITQLRIGELDHELRLSAGSPADTGDGREGLGGEDSDQQASGEEEPEQEEEVLSSGSEEDGSDSGEGDPRGQDECDPPRQPAGSESLDSDEGKQASKGKGKKKRS
tara:strand:- start:1436 stop:2026 length:591 start_codon:yes stop_codon:yes gene_type:complete